MSHDSAIQMKVSSVWPVVNHWAFMWSPLTWAFFSLFPEIFAAVFHVSSDKVILFRDSMKSVALIPSIICATLSELLSRYSLWSLHQYSASGPSKVLPACSEAPIPHYRAWGPSQCDLHPYPRLCCLYHLLSSHVTVFKLKILPAPKLIISSDTCSLSMEKAFLCQPAWWNPTHPSRYKPDLAFFLKSVNSPCLEVSQSSGLTQYLILSGHLTHSASFSRYQVRALFPYLYWTYRYSPQETLSLFLVYSWH